MNLTAGETYLEIDGEVSITNARKVVKKTSRNLVVIVEEGGGTNEIPLEGTTIDGVAAADLDEIYEFVKPLVFSNGGGNGSGLQMSDTSMLPEAGKIPIFSPQGLLSTGIPEFPENAVPLAYLNIRMPEPPVSGNYTLKSVGGTVSWVAD